ncbi:GFA family protein [Mesorhizobium sp. NBSH29]|uniref:GFA family protein n=1 Tax=Mesorhizobium sp. NBSH29 TaxID=2654249 RepID=UPI001896669B|nr:GFA family protein [Mesorhizobium sp. NBSH29]QPC87211.1 GFA family protein [Mesorhizobium sp. NBSH29]
MTEKSTLLRGACLCRAVGFSVNDAFDYAMNCHCSNCRRTTGSAFKPIAGIRTAHLSVTKGAEAIMRFGESQNHDAHCARCGSLLYSSVRDGAYVHVPLGTLDDTPSIRPTAHIFVGSKADWFDITDDLPQFDEFPVG